MKITSLEISDQSIQIAPPASRPSGRIAVQETEADGVWARLGKDGPWFKTNVRSQRDAMNKLLKAETAEGGLKLLLETNPESAGSPGSAEQSGVGAAAGPEEAWSAGSVAASVEEAPPPKVEATPKVEAAPKAEAPPKAEAAPKAEHHRAAATSKR